MAEFIKNKFGEIYAPEHVVKKSFKFFDDICTAAARRTIAKTLIFIRGVWPRMLPDSRTDSVHIVPSYILGRPSINISCGRRRVSFLFLLLYFFPPYFPRIPNLGRFNRWQGWCCSRDQLYDESLKAWVFHVVVNRFDGR